MTLTCELQYFTDSGRIHHERWVNAVGLLHNDDRPNIEYDAFGNIMYKGWFKDGLGHRIGAPAHIEYKRGDRSYTYKFIEEWIVNGQLHRDGDPARIIYHPNGYEKVEDYYQHGAMHREDGPASFLLDDDGGIRISHWMVNGKSFDINKLAEYIALTYEEKVAIKLIV